MGLGVVGCCFKPWRCVGSACNRNIGGAERCRVGRKVGLGGAAQKRVELADRKRVGYLNIQHKHAPIIEKWTQVNDYVGKRPSMDTI